LWQTPAAEIGLDVPVDLVVDVLALVIIVDMLLVVGKVIMVQNGCSESPAGGFLGHGGVVKGKLFLWDC